MAHIVLLGDSIFDNGSYTGGGPDVIRQVRERLPAGWKGTLLAVDGATTRGIDTQLTRLPGDATHLVLSVGGNDALGAQHILRAGVGTVAEAMTVLAETAAGFEASYRKVADACLRRRLPLTICTIYNGNFPDAKYQQAVSTALAAFNDAIIRVGIRNGLTVLDLRQICSEPADYANPIEPSSRGGAKIAAAIVRAIAGPAGSDWTGARIMGALP
ncbi:MAG TPA: SGNH/GDSL hydrolase family protein [Noviherbaspirillum sp.]|uniref:SGNH/GDSL hydrolase family protein n=1 Tax=Noviherbaspirillum sp. TaxID=1926288 RepID=UPI002F953DEA